MNYSFRQLELADIIETLILEQAYFEDSYSYHNELLTCLLNRGLSFVCLEEKRIVGFVKSEVLESNSVVSICVLCVSIIHRRRGIGRKLVELTIDEVKSRGVYNSIELYVSTGNIVAIQLYESFGFKSVQTIPRLYSNSFPAYRMSLNICK